MGEQPAAFDESGLQVIVGIADLVASAAVTDLQIAGLGLTVVAQTMCWSTGWETGTHAAGQALLAVIQLQHQLSTEYIDELILAAVRMPQRGLRTGRQPGQIHAEVAQPEGLAQRPLFAAGNARCKGCWIQRGSLSWWDIGRNDGARAMVAHGIASS